MHRKQQIQKRMTLSGFTLIELMVVIVIIGLLAALVVPRYIGAADKAKVTAAKTQINLFKSALTMFKLEMGEYPQTSEGLEALINNGKKNFLDQDTIPLDPWGMPYVYVCPGTQGHDFEIISYGSDRAPGGSGYAADIVSWDLQASGE
ncbi:MAG TPA: type II secretion system major pseudopilin GspG [Candidatus Hydrogenedentes bacterium]|nr:type II secretion system major pseudopilin GspG [Candidatus Hydrogenedentota bacterium]HOL77941.1 type II secretion system major pseudopilin GspG [Candidatus Hydrogenedentota bacterium]HPO85251.1 type II secretion system major pseudopilin GspG [Candidatus Hydrogenedentota bacterium]